MKKHIQIWSYWLGLTSAVITLAMRSFNALGFWLPGYIVQGVTIWYMSFYKGALLFMLINIATSLEGWSRILNNQNLNAMHVDHEVKYGQGTGKSKAARAGRDE